MLRYAILAALVTGLALPVLADVADSEQIAGHYVEVRSCDVWAGYCFSNAELGLTGEEAILAWDVTRGGWNGVDLQGLQVVAVVKANATLGDTARNPYPAKSVVIVDNGATPQQRAALVAFAQDAAGELLSDVVDVRTENIDMNANLSCAADQCATVTAGEQVAIEARCFHDSDKVCGHESTIYQPLTQVQNAMPHFTELSKFAGPGLDVTWSNSGRKSAYIATFAR